jgi:hypothetical protein
MYRTRCAPSAGRPNSLSSRSARSPSASGLGALGARWGLKALAALAARALPVSGPVPLDLAVFGFLLLVAIACGIAFGLAPALSSTPERLRDDLASVGAKLTSSTGQQRFRNALVVTQIALSLVLLVGRAARAHLRAIARHAEWARERRGRAAILP